MALYTLNLNTSHPTLAALDPLKVRFSAVVIGGDGIQATNHVPLDPSESPTGPTVAPLHSRQNMYRGTKVLKIDINGFSIDDFVLDSWTGTVLARIADHMDSGLILVRLDSTVTTSPSRIINIAAGGTGYLVGDIVTGTGGTAGTQATYLVDTVDGAGAVTRMLIATFGDYSVEPGNPVSTAGGTGAGVTLNLLFDTTPLAPATILP